MLWGFSSWWINNLTNAQRSLKTQRKRKKGKERQVKLKERRNSYCIYLLLILLTNLPRRWVKNSALITPVLPMPNTVNGVTLSQRTPENSDSMFIINDGAIFCFCRPTNTINSFSYLFAITVAIVSHASTTRHKRLKLGVSYSAS